MHECMTFLLRFFSLFILYSYKHLRLPSIISTFHSNNPHYTQISPHPTLISELNLQC